MASCTVLLPCAEIVIGHVDLELTLSPEQMLWVFRPALPVKDVNIKGGMVGEVKYQWILNMLNGGSILHKFAMKVR